MALSIFSPYAWLYSLVMKLDSGRNVARCQIKYIVIT